MKQGEKTISPFFFFLRLTFVGCEPGKRNADIGSISPISTWHASCKCAAVSAFRAPAVLADFRTPERTSKFSEDPRHILFPCHLLFLSPCSVILHPQVLLIPIPISLLIYNPIISQDELPLPRPDELSYVLVPTAAR